MKVHDKLAILKDLVGVECLCVHFVVGVLVGQVEEHAKGEVQVVRLCQASLLTQSTSLKMFIKRQFSLLKGIIIRLLRMLMRTFIFLHFQS